MQARLSVIIASPAITQHDINAPEWVRTHGERRPGEAPDLASTLVGAMSRQVDIFLYGVETLTDHSAQSYLSSRLQMDFHAVSPEIMHLRAGLVLVDGTRLLSRVAHRSEDDR